MKKLKTVLLLLFFLFANYVYSQTILDVQFPVTITTTTATSSTNPSNYNWSNTGNNLQGINIYLPPATSPNRPEIYMQQNNGKLAFSVAYSGSFLYRIDVNYDNAGWTTAWSGTARENWGWLVPPSWWTTLGNHNLKVEYYILPSGNSYVREYDFKTVKDAREFHTDQQSSNIFYRNKLTLWDDITNSNPKIPVLMVEGYDAYNSTNPEFYIQRAQTFVDKLQSNNYKVYVLDFAYNAQDMRNNAAVVHSAINYISSINSNNQIVVAGVSMGGVIARYTICKNKI